MNNLYQRGFGCVLAVNLLLSVACNDDKKPMEKRIEERKQAASAKVLDRLDAQPSEDEKLYFERKKLLETTVLQLREAERAMMAGEEKKDGSTRKFFIDGTGGDRMSKELESKLRRDNAGNYTMQKTKVVDISLKGNKQDATVEVVSAIAGRGSIACFQSTQEWKYTGSEWRLSQQLRVEKVDCPK